MKKVYDSVEDIDLFVGLTLEDDFDDALIGETFICLIAGCRPFQPRASTPDFFTMNSSTINSSTMHFSTMISFQSFD